MKYIPCCIKVVNYLCFIILVLQKEKLKPKESINLGFTFCHYFPIDLCTSRDLMLRQLVLVDYSHGLDYDL